VTEPRESPRWRSALWFGLGAASAGVIGAVAALAVIELGLYDVMASHPHTAPAWWATTTTMERAVTRQARSIRAPARFGVADADAGFRLYEANCVGCHGAPGVGQAPGVDRLMPPPPYLVNAARIWSPSELYSIIRHGLKMTGMPAWDEAMSERETWQVVAFLQRLPKLTRADYCRMRRGKPECAVAPAPLPEPVEVCAC
jgi:mono/diheme cytochrome c family protein